MKWVVRRTHWEIHFATAVWWLCVSFVFILANLATHDNGKWRELDDARGGPESALEDMIRRGQLHWLLMRNTLAVMVAGSGGGFLIERLARRRDRTRKQANERNSGGSGNIGLDSLPDPPKASDDEKNTPQEGNEDEPAARGGEGD